MLVRLIGHVGYLGHVGQAGFSSSANLSPDRVAQIFSPDRVAHASKTSKAEQARPTTAHLSHFAHLVTFFVKQTFSHQISH